MSSQLQVTTQLDDNGYTVLAEVLPGGTLPADIFVYLNTGTLELGDYQGTVSVSDLGRIQIWNNEVIPLFGNKFVRTNQAKIKVSFGTDPNSVIAVLSSNIKNLSSELSAQQTSTQVISIP